MKLLKRIMAVTVLIAVALLISYCVFSCRHTTNAHNLAVDFDAKCVNAPSGSSEATASSHCLFSVQNRLRNLGATLYADNCTGGQVNA